MALGQVHLHTDTVGGTNPHQYRTCSVCGWPAPPSLSECDLKGKRQNMGAEVEVTVEETPETPDETSRDESNSAGADHAEETIIDASIVSGVAAVRADERAADAEISEVAAEIAAVRAEGAADAVHAENQELAAIAENLRAATENILRMQAGQTAGSLPEPNSVDDPTIDVEPSNSHFLTKKWNIFGLANKKERVE
jgi:hypothetical protein